MHPVEQYLRDLKDIHRTGGGVSEESYYGALESLLNSVGSKLRPKVRAVSQLKNTGVGKPDFGLFSANQFQRISDDHPMPNAVPDRGVIEAKPWRDDSFAQTQSTQVSKYRKRYSLVLVTNFRDFVLIGKDASGSPVRLETYRISPSEKDFLALLAHPRKTANEQGDRLLEFLQRVLLSEAVLSEPEDLAWFLASYAREARFRVESASGLPALAGLKEALEEALGMKFEGEKGQHFFLATLVQTLFYGVFSSWVLWCRDNNSHSGSRFDWRAAGWTLHVPMVKSLFEQIATSSKLKPLGVDEVLDWTGAALNCVDRQAFFTKFEEEDAVQYFYEPFLKAYDPELRKELGVWYTPREIVQYQVERVDQVLRQELKIQDGLADDHVVILDPCCGTGAYLVESLKRIHKTLDEEGSSALTAQKLKKAAMDRVFGFEILPAPFVVSHLQLGLMLRLLGAPLDHETNERVGVYLTNALTGWEPPKDPKKRLALPFPELEQERDQADKVKQRAPILVVLGNPPYNAFAGTSPEEERGLVDIYKERLTTPTKDGGWGIKKFNLDDLYVRFFRVAERRITQTGKGIVCYISNFSYLGDPSFVVMRQKLLSEFDKLWIDCMNGDSRETGKVTPDGKPDPSVFSTQDSPVGIRVGTAIALMVRKDKRGSDPIVRFRHYWGVRKRLDLLDTLQLKHINRKYCRAKPAPLNRYSLRPSKVSSDYSSWPKVTDLAAQPPTNGLMEKRGGALMDFDRSALESRMRAYFDRSLHWREFAALGTGLEVNRAGIDPEKVRNRALETSSFSPDQIVRYALRPFDNVWAYYSQVPGIWNRARPAYWAQCWNRNEFVMTRPAAVADPEGYPFCYCTILGDNDFQRGHSYYFPVRLRNQQAKSRSGQNALDMFTGIRSSTRVKPNLSETAATYLAHLGFKQPTRDPHVASCIWMHVLAIGYSPAYLKENRDSIRLDWPSRLLKYAIAGRGERVSMSFGVYVRAAQAV